MSSSDDLKEELIATALPALTENVMVPFTCWSDDTNNNNIHPEVFHNATGCLRWEQSLYCLIIVRKMRLQLALTKRCLFRNLSCGKQTARQAMRDCRGLIDSLMSYIQSCVAEENPDDKVNCPVSISRIYSLQQIKTTNTIHYFKISTIMWFFFFLSLSKY